MYVLTNQQMREADAYTIEKIGVPSLELMERAGRALADKVETFIRKQKNKGIRYSIHKVAVMGCAVNGPGEAADAELGIAGGPPGKLLLFRNGVITETIPEEDALTRMEKELSQYEQH